MFESCEAFGDGSVPKVPRFSKGLAGFWVALGDTAPVAARFGGDKITGADRGTGAVTGPGVGNFETLLDGGVATLDGGLIDGPGVGAAVGAGVVTGRVAGGGPLAGGGDIGGAGPIKLGATPAAPEEGIGAIPPGGGTV